MSNLRSLTPAVAGLLLGAAVYFALSHLLLYVFGPTSFPGRVLGYWVNLLTFMVFGTAAASLLARWWELGREARVFAMALLPPVNSQRVFRGWAEVQPYADRLRDLGPAQRQLRPLLLLETCFHQARIRWSSEVVSNTLHRQTELLQIKDERHHTLARFAVWAIPTLGFIGTVLGIGEALQSLQTTGALAEAVRHLHTVFDTTFVALMLSLPANWLQARVQAEDDASLARAADWCQQHFILAMRGEGEAVSAAGPNNLVKVSSSPVR